MERIKGYTLIAAALLSTYLAVSTNSETIQERTRINIEQSKFGVLFRRIQESPKAKIYGNNGAKTAEYKDTLDVEGLTYIIEAKARDENQLGVRDIGDGISGTVTTTGDSPEGKFTMKTPLLEQRISSGFFGSLILSTELFIGEGTQADLDRFYSLLERSLIS